MKKLLAILMVLALALGVAACAQPDSGNQNSGENEEPFKVAFVCKFLTSVWFAPKSDAMNKRAEELGMIYIGIDANDDEETFIQGVQNAINQEVNGIILTPVNTAMLPAIVDMIREAGIAYMTTDDPGFDSDGNPVPHLGLEDYSLGEAVAKHMVVAAKDRGFVDDPERVTVVLLGMPAVEGFHKRVVGGYDVVKEAFPEIPEDNYIWIDTVNGSAEHIIPKLEATFNARREFTDYWIVLGGDEGAGQGSVPIFEENNVPFTNVLISTINGSDVLPSIMRQSEEKANSIFFSGILPAPSGAALVDLMYDLFKNGNPIPEFTGYPEDVRDASNFEDFANQLS